MALLFYCGVALLTTAVAVATRLAWERPTAYVPVKPRPVVYQNIRLLRDHDEVRELARQAREREQLIATAAERRAARFGELTRPRPQATPDRSVQ